MVTKAPTAKPGAKTKETRDGKNMPKPSAKTLSEENKDTRKGGK